MTTLQTYLTAEPIPPHVTTPILDQQGNVIATWTSTNQRQPIEVMEVEEAVRWAMAGDKYLLIRKGDSNEC